MSKRTLLLLCLCVGLGGCLDEDSGGELGIDPAVTGPGEGGGAIRPFYLGPSYALFFSPAGDAFYATTWSGLVDTFDVAAAKARKPKDGGRWRVSGNKLNIAWGDNTTWVLRIEANGALVTESGRKAGESVRQPPAVMSGMNKSFKRGNFSYFGVDSTNTAAGSVSGDHWVYFRQPDQLTVVDEVSVFINGELLVDSKRRAGRYTLDGYTIAFTDDKGKTTQHNLWVRAGTTDAPELIAFDGSIYLVR